jgi:PAS domain S-box-containing protein
MNDIRRTKDQLIKELKALRRKTASLEKKSKEKPAHKKPCRRDFFANAPFDVSGNITDRKHAELMLEASEKRFRSVLEGMQLIGVMLNRKGEITFCNDFLLNLTGWKRKEVLYKSWFKLFLPSDKRDYIRKSVFFKTIETGSFPSYYQNEILTRDGKRRLIAWNNTVLKDEKGDVVSVTSIGEDITERKLSLDALKESEERYRLLFHGLRDAVYVHEISPEKPGKFIAVNETACRMLGYTEEELLRMDVKDIDIPEQAENISALHERLFRDGHALFETFHVAKGGRKIPVEVNVRLFTLRKKTMVLSVARDITERKQMAEALRKREAQLSNAMEIAKLGYWEYDVDDDLFTFDDQFYSIFRTSVEKVGGYKMSPARYAQLFLHPDDMPIVAIEMKKALETTDPHFSRQLEHRIIYADGEIGYISVRYFVIKDDNGRTIKTYGANQDITGRKRAEEALRESEEKYRLLFNAESDAIMVFEGDTRKVIDVNNAAVQLYGYGREEFLNMFLKDISAEPDKSEKSVQQILAGEIMKIPLRYHRKKDGTVLPVEVSAGLFIMNGRKIVIAAVRDISERVTAEEKIKTYHKRLSELASKIALIAEDERRRFADELHDHTGQNLALAKIKLSELRDSLPDKGILDRLDELYQLIDEAAASTRSLTFELSPPILYEIGFEAAAEWLGEQILRKYNISFHFDDDTRPKPLPDEAKVLLFVSLRELIVNITKHSKARNATVTLRRAGNMLHVSVTDDGIGFDASTLDFQIMKATSFGLFSTRERVERLGGRLEIASQSEKGTTVTMVVPLKI